MNVSLPSTRICECGQQRNKSRQRRRPCQLLLLLKSNRSLKLQIFLVETLVLKQRALYKDDKKESLRGLRQAWQWYNQFTFGLLLVIFITEAGKSIVAEPRPHFLDTCQPDKAVNCTSGWVQSDSLPAWKLTVTINDACRFRYVSDFKCTNINIPSYRLKDSFRSFPSGHSSLGLYMAVFMMVGTCSREPPSAMTFIRFFT